MRIFFIGDIVGKPGRKLLGENLAKIREEFGVDFVIANAENSAGGNGITKNMADELFRYGVDAITLGDHLWDQRCFESEIDSVANLCRPANIPECNPGRDFVILEKNGVKLGIFSLLGQTLMKIKSDCPFAAANRMLEKVAPLCDVIFVDFHAETSSEKVSMAWHLDGRAQALVGTHTHIPTNDARIFPHGLAFQCDAGMTGPWNSCLGRNWDTILKKFIDGRPRAFTMASGDDRICAVMIDIDVAAKRAVFIAPFARPPFPTNEEMWKAANERAECERAEAQAKKARDEAKSAAKQQAQAQQQSVVPTETSDANTADLK